MCASDLPLHRTDILIVGAGPAGYTAAIYAARAALGPILVAGLQPGGQLTITDDVENFPGFANPVQGPWLMEQMRQQAESAGTVLRHDLITEADLKNGPDEEGYFHLKGDSGEEYHARTVVIATGAQARWLGLESETRYRGAGVSACATCDGFFYRGKEVAVIGGGNTAVEEALYLTRHASKVHLIHRREGLKAEKILQKRLFENPKVRCHWNREVADILGQKGGNAQGPDVVRALLLRPVKKADPGAEQQSAGQNEELAIEGVFIAIGHNPSIGPFRDEVACDEEGYIITKPGTAQTSVPGVYAAGDIQDRRYRQAVTAAGTGCMAALEAEHYLAHSTSTLSCRLPSSQG